MKTDDQFCLLGKLKMLKPFKFRQYGKWTGGFQQHGIFEIIGKKGDHRFPDSPQCTIRRIATCRPDCELGETHTFPEDYLSKYTVPTNLDAFQEEPTPNP